MANSKQAFTDFRIYTLSDFDKWIKQNKGEYVESFPSVLLDYSIIACKRGTCFVFDEYMNPNKSCYHCFYFRSEQTGSSEYKTIEESWYKLQSAYYAEYGIEE